MQRYDITSISRDDRDNPTYYSPLPHIAEDNNGDYVLYSDAEAALAEKDKALADSMTIRDSLSERLHVANEQIATLKADRDRLDERDGQASFEIIHPVPDDPNPFNRIDLKKIDFGVSDNCYVLECPEIEKEIAALTATIKRLEEIIEDQKNTIIGISNTYKEEHATVERLTAENKAKNITIDAYEDDLAGQAEEIKRLREGK